MAESEGLSEAEPTKLKLKVGRPRKYVGGWTSVSNLLVKQIKLHTTVYIRWCQLKGQHQHSEFATLLLDVYELYVAGGLLSPSETHQDVTVEEEIAAPLQVFSKRKLSRRRSSVQPVHIECYEDIKEEEDHGVKYEITAETEEHLDSASSSEEQIQDFSNNAEDDKGKNIAIEYIEGEENDVVITFKSQQILSAESQDTLKRKSTDEGDQISDSDIMLCKKAKKGRVFNLQDNKTGLRTFDSTRITAGNQLSKKRGSFTTASKPTVQISLPSFFTPRQTIAIKNWTSTLQSTLKPLLNPMSLSELVPPNFSDNASLLNSKPQETESLVFVSNKSQNESTILKVQTPSNVFIPLSKTTEDKPAPSHNKTDPIGLRTNNSITCSTDQHGASEINMVPPDTVVSTIDMTNKELKSSTTELAVAKIISSLSESFVRTNSQKPGKQAKQCLNCQKLQKPLKNVKVMKVRHMATQFSTHIVKPTRQVSTQTPIIPSWSVGTWIDNDYFSKSVETQYWPSPLWTRFLSHHPEVIYNIDSNQSPEFPPNFKLYRKGEHLFSTLFGSRYKIQKRPSMRCISVSEFGGPEVMRLLSGMPTPIPAAKHVLVNVKAAGVNPVDTYIRSGFYASKPKLPYTPGKDGAGFIQQVGDDVTKVKKGDRVWFFGSTTGSYAEYCICHEDNVGQLPNNVSFEDGAMVGTPYVTAYRALFQKGKVKRGETVLIHGASGGVGTAAVQICSSCGIRVIATAGSSDGEQMLRNMGVVKVYNHRKENYVEQIKKDGEKLDVIVEMLANVNLLEDLKMISLNGRIVVVGSRGPIEIDPRLIMSNEVTVTGVMLVKSTAVEKEVQINYMNDGLVAGWLKPALWKTIEVEFAKEAHREIIENEGARGQIVLKVDATFNKPEYLPTEL